MIIDLKAFFFDNLRQQGDTMPGPRHLHPKDLQGLTRLSTEATRGVTDLVESMQRSISRSALAGSYRDSLPEVVSGVVYQSIRGVNRLVGSRLDVLLDKLHPMIPPGTPTAQREALLSAFGGVLGDHLEASSNPLAIKMSFRFQGEEIDLAPGTALPAGLAAGSRLLVAIHGLCMNDLQWTRKGRSHVQKIADEFGFTPVWLRYNSGRHISTNGRQLALLLDSLIRRWPVGVEEIVLLGHSMGGLVARSACHYAIEAKAHWPALLSKMFFLGSPHGGALLEKAGHLFERALDISRYSAPLVALSQVRSSGITDLRHGSILDRDWDSAHRFERVIQHRDCVALPQGVACYAIAAVNGSSPGLHEDIVGDGLVSLRSALGVDDDPRRRLGIPAERRAIFYGMTHMGLLDRSEVTDQLRHWMAC